MNAPSKVISTKKSLTLKERLTPLYNLLSVGVIALGVGAFYVLKLNIWLKWLIVIIATLAGLGIFFFISPTGNSLHGYIQESWRELNKVVWPTRKEATHFTWIICLFVLILGLLLWGIDSSLSWLFYNIILGRSN